VNPAYIAAALFFTLLLGFVSFVQLLYLEALRLRSRELPALALFKNQLEAAIGLKTEDGVLAVSLIKHTLLVLTGLLTAVAAARGGILQRTAILEAAAFGLLAMVVGAYIGPQFLYRKTGGRWLIPFVPLIKLLAILARPLTAFFSLLQTLAALGSDEKENDENGGSVEENLEALIEAGAGEGLIEEDDRKLIHSVVALGDKTVREVMTPRPKLIAIQEDATIEDFRTVAINNHFSRLPVYTETIDTIAGFVHVRDILKLNYDERSRRKVSEFIYPTKFVPETKPVADLFREMQKDNVHMAIVVDEYGETAGIATMEDVMEEVFGEIEDESDPKANIDKEADGAYLLSGNVDLDELHELLEFRPGEDTESTTVGGLVTEWLGRVPAAGEAVEKQGIRLEVTESDERHVEQVRVLRVDPE